MTDLKDFEILEEIGDGAFSKVFKVKNLQTGQYFAMKKIDYEHLPPQQKIYANSEIDILKKIRHPNIIAFETSFHSAGFLYIVMELASGGDLQKKIFSLRDSNSSFPIDTIWSYTYQLLQAINTLHSLQIIHRDIKPANVFICDNNIVKLGDFNVGKSNVTNLVKTRIGTPLTMSPEVLHGKEYSLKADIWSLGCVIYEMTLLKKPYEASYEIGLFKKVGKVKIIVPFDKKLESLIKKLMKYTPDRRPTCSEMLASEYFKRFKSPDERPIRSRREKKIKTCGRAPSFINLSINKDFHNKKKSYESPSSAKLKRLCDKTYKTPSNKQINPNFKLKLNECRPWLSPEDSPDYKSNDISKINRDNSVRVIELNEKNNDIQKYCSHKQMPKSLTPRKVSNILGKINSIHIAPKVGGFSSSRKRLQVLSFDKEQKNSTLKAAKIYFNDFHIVKQFTHRKNSSGTIGLLNKLIVRPLQSQKNNK